MGLVQKNRGEMQLYLIQPYPARISMIGFSALEDIFGDSILGTFFEKMQFFSQNIGFSRTSFPMIPQS